VEQGQIVHLDQPLVSGGTVVPRIYVGRNFGRQGPSAAIEFLKALARTFGISAISPDDWTVPDQEPAASKGVERARRATLPREK